MAQALQNESLLAGVVDSSGNVLAGGSATFYETDGTTIKTVWADSEKVATLANPSTLSSSGTLSVFMDGTYSVVIKNAAGSTIYNWNSIQFSPNNPNDLSYISATDHGSTKDEATISTAISSASGADRTVYLDPGDWTITDDLTIPSNINLRFEMGAYCTISAGKTLTITGVIEAPIYNVFRGTGTVTYTDGRVNDRPSVWAIGGTQDNRTILGIWSLTGQLNVDNLRVDGGTISSTSGGINITPLAGEDVVIDGHFEFDGVTLSALTDANTVIAAFAGKNITIESVTFDGGVVAGVTTLAASGGIDTHATGVFYKTAIVDIGDWNMNTTANRAITHGITLTKIRAVNVTIRNDANTAYYNLHGIATGTSALTGGVVSFDSTHVNAERVTGGIFDAVGFATTSYNRGWAFITYEA